MKGKTVAIIAVIFIIYLLLGAVLFHFIESPYEQRQKEIAKELQMELMANLSDIFTHSEIINLVETIKFIVGTGLNLTNNETNPTNWDINSAFFSLEQWSPPLVRIH